ncbi:MAG: TonB C-terminal domain-containing protein [Vicinamibacterales bacterium]
MYFNFEDYRPDTPTLPRSLTRLEVALLTLVFYLCVVILLLVWPHLEFVKAWEAERQQALVKIAQEQQHRDSPRVVFLEPYVERPTSKPLNSRPAPVERARKPTNSTPFSRGNTPDRSDEPPAPPQRMADAQPDPSPDTGRKAMPLPDSPTGAEPKSADPRGPAVGMLADAIRHAGRYAPRGSNINLEGGEGQNFSKTFQFDDKGVDFSSWLRRFKARVERNWILPTAANFQRGHVVLRMVIWKDGRITELRVIGPSAVDAFNNSSFGALASSTPVDPLPLEYPDDRLIMTVTFFYNENPG